MNTKFFKKSIMFLLLLVLPIEGQNFNKAGRTAMTFLKIGIGAREAGLGQACIANTREINAVFWNPGAITGINDIEASFSYIKWIGDLNITSGVLGISAGNLGIFALSYIALDYGSIQEALVTSPGGSVDTRTGQSFGGSDLAIGLAFSRRYTERLSIGINVKYIREELFTFDSSVWGVDVGSYYDTGWKGIRLAMAAQNFSKQARWMYTREEFQQTFELPLLFRIGASVDLIGGSDFLLGGNPDQHKISINVDAIHSNDYAERLHLGTEYTFFNRLFFRSGYRLNYDEGNLSFGFGIKQQAGTMNINIDYAYVDYDYLQGTHRFTMTISR